MVEDEPGIRELLVEILRAEEFEVETAATGLEALHALERGSFELMLLDLEMPAMTGLDLLRSQGLPAQRTGVVVLTGCGDLATAVEAMQLGALDYILKPFDASRVVTAVEKGQTRLAQRTRENRRNLESLLGPQAGQWAGWEAELAQNAEKALEALVVALDARERETQHHSRRVSEYAVHLAAALSVDEPYLGVIRRAGILHDIGKIGVPDRILLKPGPLTEGEWRLMKAHPEIGRRILQTLGGFERESEIVLTHHERYDGLGYPRRLAGSQIPLGSRIFSVVDSFDAMTSDRPYRRAMSFEAAVQEIARCSGSQFDPEIAGLFLRIPEATWNGIRARAMRREAGRAVSVRRQKQLPA